MVGDNFGTVEYFVKSMLDANVEREKIFQVARSMASLFGVKSETEAELLAREYFDTYEKGQLS